MKKISQEIKERVIEARISGMKYSAIAAECGISKAQANKICMDAGFRVRGVQGKTCPKCHRGEFPAEYVFCPFCQTDMRSEKELCIERLERAAKLIPSPHNENASQINFAILKAIEYLKKN